MVPSLASEETNRAVRSRGILEAVLTATTIRLAVLIVGLFATVTIGSSPGVSRPGPGRAVAELPNRWDADWYIGIASGGYRYRPTAEARWNRLAFFPAYPMTLRAVAHVLPVPRSSAAWGWVGVALSLGAFAWASMYVYRLAARWGTDPHFTVAILAAYPFALFFGGVYTESFFLLGTAATFWYFGQGSFGRAAVWGVFTGLVRPNAMLLAAPLAVWMFASRSPVRNDRRWWAALAVFAPLLGNSLYSAYLWQLTGDPLIWISAQEGWGRTYLGLTGAVRDVASSVQTLGLGGFVEQRPYDFINASAGVLALGIVIPVARALGLPAAVFIVLNLVPPLMVGGLPSLGRYTSVLFPLHIWIARATPERWRWAVLATMAMAQALMAALHYTSRAIY